MYLQQLWEADLLITTLFVIIAQRDPWGAIPKESVGDISYDKGVWKVKVAFAKSSLSISLILCLWSDMMDSN
jgi:hypothetical protein